MNNHRRDCHIAGCVANSIARGAAGAVDDVLHLGRTTQSASLSGLEPATHAVRRITRRSCRFWEAVVLQYDNDDACANWVNYTVEA